ncbi:MAG: hypothetical protein GY793_07375 [Proteobacteria bacterium]|nr:hypothetical protein [Pseudomonadota bacterium]
MIEFLKKGIKVIILNNNIFSYARSMVLFFRNISKYFLEDQYSNLLNKNIEINTNLNYDISGKKFYFAEALLDTRYSHISKLLNATMVKKIKDAEFAIIWGRGFKISSLKTLKLAQKLEIPVFVAEDGFLRSVDIGTSGEQTLSVQLDTLGGIYYDARTPSIIEFDLNKSYFNLAKWQIALAKEAMGIIKEKGLSKYNLTMPEEIKWASKEQKKVLVLDQRYGDQSVMASLTTPDKFEDMLQAAIDENPGAQIILKIHPDVITGGLKSHFNNLDKRTDITLLTENYNPVSLLKSVDKVYTVCSGMGFEALICGKEVVCFGVPFYSNWGLTDDRIKLGRRQETRTLEDVFYTSYIKFCNYYNDKTNKSTDIIDVINRLAEKRDVSNKVYCHCEE